MLPEQKILYCHRTASTTVVPQTQPASAACMHSVDSTDKNVTN
jgi:hypothetical protein